jgi:hypothetical protein
MHDAPGHSKGHRGIVIVYSTYLQSVKRQLTLLKPF